MIALGLVRVIERHSNELAAELTAKLETSSRTADLLATSSGPCELERPRTRSRVCRRKKSSPQFVQSTPAESMFPPRSLPG
jgi:hypothetical protein